MSRNPSPPVSPLWRQNPIASRTSQRQSDKRRWGIFALLATILAVAGALLGLLSWIRPIPRPYFVPLWVSSYQSRQIPFLAWADQDLHALMRGGYSSRVVASPFGSLDRRTIRRELGALANLSASDSVVVYVNARACVGRGGEVLVLPADADPDDVDTWISLREFLEALRDSPAQRKLLVLDLMKPPGGERTVFFDFDVASRVPAELNRTPDPQRLTLVAAAPGQFSLTSEELGRSIFSYYFEEALRGWTELDRPRLSRDGLVRVKSLADYVRRRVDRWARLNRGVRQEPMLYGDGADFPLLALKHDALQPAPPLPQPQDYPAWLEAGWAVRDRWRTDGSDRIAPLPFRKMEQTLLTAELEWRGGVDPARIQQDRIADLAHYQQELELVRTTAEPRPASLALAAAQGWTRNPAVAAALSELLAKRDEKAPAPKAAATPTATTAATPTAKPKADGDGFAATLRSASAMDLAGAVFDAAREREPTRETILDLDAVLKERQPEPQFVETLWLRQLAVLAREGGPSVWPTETVRRSLKVAEQGEQANSRPESLRWLQPALDDAAQLRHNAEVLLRAPGFAAVTEADRLLRLAEAQYSEILAQQRIIQGARGILLEALQYVPLSTDFLDSSTMNLGQWRQTIETAIAIRETVDGPSGDATLPNDEVRRRIEALDSRVESLRQDLLELHQPNSNQSLTTLQDQARGPRAGPETLRAIERALQHPFLSSKQRVALWKSSRDLARRLLKTTLEQDRHRFDQDATRLSTSIEPQLSHSQRLGIRAYGRISLLRLAGLPEPEARSLEDRIAKVQAQGNDPTSWWDLEMDLRFAWNGGADVKDQPSDGERPPNRLNPLVAPVWSLTYFDTSAKGYYLVRRLREHRALWAWLADHFDYESADLGGSPFFHTAAREYRTLAGTPDQPSVLSPWELPSPVVHVSAEEPTATATLTLRERRNQDGDAPSEFDVLLADPDWLRVGPASTALRRPSPKETGADGLGTTFALVPTTTAVHDVPLRIELDPDAESSDVPPPRGFLVRVRVGGRDFHQAVKVEQRRAGQGMQILLSADPKQPTEPRQDLALRVIKDRQPYFLYLQNLTDDAQDVVVEADAGEQAAAVAPRLTVAPRAIARVPFAPGAIKPDAPLPELTGPLQVVVRSAADKTTIVGRAQIDVRIVSPAEYVQVSRVEYAPAGRGGATESRLSVGLRVIEKLAGPPAVARLVLPADQIPGLLGLSGGALRGVLPSDGTPLTLFAKGLRRAPGSDAAGSFYIQVDDYPRGIAFRATFPSEGQPTVPMEDVRPALRIQAARSTAATAKFPVRAEVDNPRPGDLLEIVLGRVQAGSIEPEVVRRFPTAQQRRIGFAPGGPDGSLLFEASADDWNTTLDLTGIEGARVLRARLLDGDGVEVLTDSQPLLIDDGSPTAPTFLDLPAQARRGSRLTVKATAQASDSGINAVRFFVGRPPAAGAALPATVAVAPGVVDESGFLWSGVLTLPDLKGPTDLSAAFDSGAGLTSYATGTVELTDADPITPGRIQGTVYEGPRPQPGLVVVLSQAPSDDAQEKKAKPAPKDEKSQELSRATTNAEGAFRFDGLAPGKYQLSTRKEASLTKARLEVNVKAGSTATATLELYR